MSIMESHLEIKVPTREFISILGGQINYPLKIHKPGAWDMF